MAFVDLIDLRNADKIIAATIQLRDVESGDASLLTISGKAATLTIPGGSSCRFSGVVTEWTELGYAADFHLHEIQEGDGALTLAMDPLSEHGDSLQLPLQTGEIIGAEIRIYVFLSAPGAETYYGRLVYRGAVTEMPTISRGSATIVFSDYSRVQKIVPPTEVTKADFPNAPDDSIGVPIPICYGSFAAEGDPLLDYPEDGLIWGLGKLGGMPAICVDENLAEADKGPKFRICGHRLKTYTGHETGVALMEPELDAPSWVDAGAADFALADAYTDFLSDHPLYARVPVCPVKPGSTNQATDPSNAWDRDLSTYATLSAGVGETEMLTGALPGLPELGTIKNTYVGVFLGGVSGTIRFGLRDEAGDWVGGSYDDATTGGWHWVEIITTELGPLLTWDLSTYYLEVQAQASSACHALEIRYSVRYVPNREMNVAAQARTRHLWAGGGGTKPSTFDPWVDRSKMAKVEAGIFVHGEGVADDASGTYTGTPYALIQNGADIAHHLLANYSELPSGSVELTSAIGGLTLARIELGTYHKLRVWMGDKEDARDVFARICKECRAVPVWNSDGKRGMVVVSPEPETNYRSAATFEWKANRDFFADSFRCGRTSVDDIANAVYIDFDYCFETGKFQKTAYITPTGSDNGLGTDDDADRVALAAASASRFGATREWRLQAYDVRRQGVAKALRNYYFDIRQRPRAWVEFECGTHACDLSTGNMIHIDEEDICGIMVPCPDRVIYDSDDRYWSSYVWYVERVALVASPTGGRRYRVRAIEAIVPATANDWIAAADDGAPS